METLEYPSHLPSQIAPSVFQIDDSNKPSKTQINDVAVSSWEAKEAQPLASAFEKSLHFFTLGILVAYGVAVGPGS